MPVTAFLNISWPEKAQVVSPNKMSNTKMKSGSWSGSSRLEPWRCNLLVNKHSDFPGEFLTAEFLGSTQHGFKGRLHYICFRAW